MLVNVSHVERLIDKYGIAEGLKYKIVKATMISLLQLPIYLRKIKKLPSSPSERMMMFAVYWRVPMQTVLAC